MPSDLLTADELGKAVIYGAVESFRANKGWADQAIAQLPDEKLHVALDSNTNSIAIIMKHVAGNLLSHWTTITIPRGGSATFNQRVWGSGGYQKQGSIPPG